MLFLGVLKTLKPRPKLSKLIEKRRLYTSRSRIVHQVKDVQHVGSMMYLTLDCGMRVAVRDSSRGRASRWLNEMIFWSECKHCHFPENPSKTAHPRERLKVAPEKKYSRRELRLGNFEVKDCG
jgi:pyrrolysyl-tRNA synthetase-like protein